MNEIEEKFYKTFGIEPKEEHYCYWECKVPELKDKDCQKRCKYQKHNILYPEITDRIYIELHCLLNCVDAPPYGRTAEQLKRDILINAINTTSINETEQWHKWFKNKVQSLFREGEE